MKTQQKSPKLKVTAIVLMVILCASGGAFAYKQHQKNEAIATERAQYAQAEKDLDALNAQIITKLGQPDDSKKVKECGYTSDTFELAPKGELFCNIGWQLDYKVKDIYEAYALSQQTETLNRAIVQSELISDEEVSESIRTSAMTPVDLGASNYEFAELSCFTAYSVNTISGAPSLLNNDSLKLHIEMNCAAKNPLTEYLHIKAS